jgi:hypothetical protein
MRENAATAERASLQTSEESLLRIPLVRHLIEDPLVALIPRGIDERWSHSKLSQTDTRGFNPSHGAVYYAARSALAGWLKHPEASARELNESDHLAKYLLFSVHDYLHAWSYQAIAQLVPEIGFGTRPITRDNIESFVFCHLLTEAAATVGLDYWYLSTVELDQVCPIGTTVVNVATDFHQRYVHEYHRFNPRFEVQRIEFFGDLARFYMSGSFRGFNTQDARRSPRLLKWLTHELSYGAKQREFTRRWLRDLSNDEIPVTGPLAAPVDDQAPWQVRLYDELGALLWEKIKENVRHRFAGRLDPREAWCRPADKPLDFRFVNANRFRDADVTALETGNDAEINFDHYMDQLVSQHVFDRSAGELHDCLRVARRTRSTRLVRRLLRDVERVPCADEPVSLFFIN